MVGRDDPPAEIDQRDLAVLDADRPGTDLAMCDAGMREPFECGPAAGEELIPDLVGSEGAEQAARCAEDDQRVPSPRDTRGEDLRDGSSGVVGEEREEGLALGGAGA